MAKYEVIMPKMGESIEEATITQWFKKVGDKVEEDDVLLEIATDKVDSEIPSPVEGIIKEIFFNVDDLVPVGEVVAIIDMDDDGEDTGSEPDKKVAGNPQEQEKQETKETKNDFSDSTRFYSPLVKSIAKQENLSIDELEQIEGSGANGRVNKQDVLNFLNNRGAEKSVQQPSEGKQPQSVKKAIEKPTVTTNQGDEIVEMDRMRRLIADHMVMSKQVSPHVTNFVEADVTNMVLWRNRVKDEFQKRESQKITFMPIFIEATAKALRDFPGINASVDGYNIILRKNVNIGIAVALPSGNLIVPVIKNADQKNLVGLTHELNKLADDARKNKLSPDDIQGGTFSITNFGSFKNTIGTPIINQPQVAILAVGNIEKKPAVLETPSGDVIAIRHKMFLSLSYDHRVVDGALGGAFLRRLADYLEDFDINREV